METAKISIIIPVYKVEEYLSQCMDSVLRQTYRNLQIILVDDGTPDRCGSLCDEYARLDERILVLHKENGGLSSARNAGTEQADGDFLFYLDSDDYLEPTALEHLLAAQARHAADIVCAGYWYTYPNREEAAPTPYSEETLLGNQEAMEALMGGRLQTFAWGKLIRSSIAKLYRFPDGKLFEDHFWTHLVFGDAERVVYTNTPIVHYRQRDDSISFTFTYSRLDVLEGWCGRKAYLQEHYPKLEGVFLANCAKQYVNLAWLVLTRLKGRKREAFQKMRSINKLLRLEDHSDQAVCALIRALGKSNFAYARKAFAIKIKDKLGL